MNGARFYKENKKRIVSSNSLLVSMLHSYFAGKKDLFKGLAIEKLEKEWMKYPVLHFDMSLAKHLDKEKLNDYLVWKLRDYNEKYGLTKNNDAAVNNQLADLIKCACEQTGRKVVVLIDEYDVPLLDVVHEEKNLPALRNVMCTTDILYVIELKLGKHTLSDWIIEE